MFNDVLDILINFYKDWEAYGILAIILCSTSLLKSVAYNLEKGLLLWGRKLLWEKFRKASPNLPSLSSS